ncbi:hypothetical protein L7F22_026283 [Adiantum nelumboides]|nr:hypothetical protein [Adiantum nelumboides]
MAFTGLVANKNISDLVGKLDLEGDLPVQIKLKEFAQNYVEPSRCRGSTKTVIAVKDKHGFRPLVIGKIPVGEGIMFASETFQLEAAGLYQREVHPREMMAVKDGRIINVMRLLESTYTQITYKPYLLHPYLENSHKYQRNVKITRSQTLLECKI